MKASKITHHNETRIRVDFPYNQEMVSLLRQIADARWSKTLGAWHIPYSSEAFQKLKSLFPDVEIMTEPIIGARLEVAPRLEKKNAPLIIKKPNQTEPAGTQLDVSNQQHTEETKSEKTNVTAQKRKIVLADTKNLDSTIGTQLKVAPRLESISIEITSKHIFIKIPKNEADIQFVRSFKFVKWDSVNYCWVVPNYSTVAHKIKAYFQARNPQITELVPVVEKTSNTEQTFSKNELLVVNQSNRVLKVYFSYNKEVLTEIKKIPLSNWNADEHCWTIPYAEKFISEIKQIAQQYQLEFKCHEEIKGKVKPRTSRHDIVNYRECPPEYIAKLKELRYSQNTLETYKHMFEEFINHFSETEPKDITDEMIVDFLRYLVNERNISGSYQNQSINAIHPVGLFIN
ncbi:MAG: phage integrase N-terminal SAM-like domain-containing protein [Bacteroidota bacterium]